MLILTPCDPRAAPVSGPATVLDWVTSVQGQTVQDHGQCAAALLPRDDDVVLVLPPRTVSWHRLSLPKVASVKLRAVLDGLLEERLLNDTAELHYALEPGGRSGQTVWVAVCDRTWLRGWLQVLETLGRPVSRIVPALWPLPADDAPDAEHPPTLHWAHPEGEQAWLASASPLGVRCTPLRESSSAPALQGNTGAGSSLPTPAAAAELHSTRWLADPAVAALAESALGQRFELLAQPVWLLRCAQSDWNLAQFDFSLSAGARRTQRLRQALRRWRSAPAWRAARWGVATLAVVQLLGLNVAAWSERERLDAKEQALHQILQQSFPGVTLVLDAALQMERELARLQQASGQLSAGDLETLLGALSDAAVGEMPLATVVGYSAGEGRFGGWQASAEQLRALQQTLQQHGWRARLEGNDLILQPAQSAARPNHARPE